MNINNSKYIFYAFNKKWKSIRECCKYYEVRYGSVMSYKRIHKCTAEEAIAYCRNLKKLGIFYFKKVRWTNLKECCDYYNINYKSLCTYMQKNKISKEEALSHYYQYYKYNRFTYNHVTYDSFAACCEAYNIKSVCVRRYARKKHFLLRHAFACYLNYHNKRKMYFCGQEYITFTSCCRAFGCNASYVSAYAKRHGISREEALKFYINRIEKQEGQKIDSRTFVFRDSIYHDLSDCCHKLGINVSSVYGYMWRTKKGKVEAVEYYYNKKMEDYFEWESVLYSSLSACCTKFDVSLKAVRNRAWRKNCSIQEAFRHCLRRKQSLETDVFYYRGDEYKNLKECCEKYNINVQSVHSYRFRNKDSDYDEAIDYIRKITENRQFIWEDGSVYESINSFCRMKSISVSSVRDKARKKGMSLQEAAKYYIERNSYD